ncbi:hypothetical protein ADK38_21115 [Streptomyces varsoviensis]|uniref:Transposase IS4-like domain-containing protein n=1 Tax=Streptomyces varsoviensis TaxID=67373 RepID=A0ABR5J471_9ACTN|nr:hypothetical protein ADK38_21115 [Streptomyces varsoviensis]
MRTVARSSSPPVSPISAHPLQSLLQSVLQCPLQPLLQCPLQPLLQYPLQYPLQYLAPSDLGGVRGDVALAHHLVAQRGQRGQRLGVQGEFQRGRVLLQPGRAALYQERWEIESVLGEIKTHQRGRGVVIPSRAPDGVRQQIWAHLLVHHALRELMHRCAAGRGLDPDRLSFTDTLRAARRSITTTPGVFSP